MLVLTPIVLVIDSCSKHFPSATGTTFVVVTALSAVALMSIIWLFWYLVVTEVELRKRGETLLRLRGFISESIKITALLLMGLAAFAYAYRDGELLLRLGRSKVDAILGGLFLAAWGIVLIRLSIQDVMTLFGKRSTRRAR